MCASEAAMHQLGEFAEAGAILLAIAIRAHDLALGTHGRYLYGFAKFVQQKFCIYGTVFSHTRPRLEHAIAVLPAARDSLASYFTSLART